MFQVPPLQSAAAAASAAQRVTAHSIDQYFRDELIYKRNRRMGERILELLWARPNESYFFAFGAGEGSWRGTRVDDDGCWLEIDFGCDAVCHQVLHLMAREASAESLSNECL